MRIAQVNVYFKPFMVGGAEWYVYNVSRELVRMGHEVEVFTADRCNGEAAPAFEVIEGIKVHRVPLKADWSYRMKAWQGLKESLAGGSFDVIHAYDYAQPHTLDALDAAEKSGSGSALTVFDIHSMIPRSLYKQVPMKFMERYFAKRTLPRTDKILVRAPNLIAPLVEMGARRESIVVTPSGVRDESLGSFDGRRFLERHGIGADRHPIILYVGRLNPLKGPEKVLQAAPSLLKDHPGATFVFMGPDQSGYKDHLLSIAKEKGLESRVCFTGPIYDFQEKMEAYASCDVFVLPTSYEGTSQAIFEAMSQARPIVATEVGGIPSQIENGKEGILVPFGDVDALAMGMKRVLGDPDFAKAIGARARAKVEGFTYSKLAGDLVQIYSGIGRTKESAQVPLASAGA